MIKRDEILTIPQAAKYCAVDRMSMWRWVKAGNIRVSVTPGGHHRILREDLEAFLIEKGMYPLAQKQFPRKKILIVDDDVSIQRVLSKMLTDLKYETAVASDGFEAGIKVVQFKPDLIILDLIMPGMDGFEVCKLIRANSATAHIKILTFTGYDTEENREKILRAGADAYMAKPVDRAVLLTKIEDLLGSYGKRRTAEKPQPQKSVQA